MDHPKDHSLFGLGLPGYSQCLVEIRHEKFENPPLLQLEMRYKTRAKYPTSSYTACVHDVAVGNWDICVPWPPRRFDSR